MTLTIESGLSSNLKIQFINEIVELHSYKNITTSKFVIKNKVNIKTDSSEILKSILDKINKTDLNITINKSDDTIIVLD